MSAQRLDRSGAIGDNRKLSSAADLAVRVWGMAADGRTFTQNALVRSLNREGAVIAGLLQELSVGEIIGVQYKERKARFRVERTDNRQASNGNAEIKLLAHQQCPWHDQLHHAGSETAHLEHRQWRRDQTCFPVELRNTDSDAPMRMSATDVSGNGCYVQTMVAPATGTRWVVSFWIGSEKITCECTVKTCDVGFGMGIEFTGLDHETKHRLQSWLDENCTSQSKSVGA